MTAKSEARCTCDGDGACAHCWDAIFAKERNLINKYRVACAPDPHCKACGGSGTLRGGHCPCMLAVKVVTMPKSQEQLQQEADRRNEARILSQKDPSRLLPWYWVVRDQKLVRAR
jgi:hypothetical protein